MRLFVLPSLLALLAIACSSTPDTTAGGTSSASSSSTGAGGALACTPGAQVACACPGGGQGAQICAADGRSLGACEGCDGAGGATATSSTTATTGTGGAGGEGGAGAAATSSATTSSATTGVGGAGGAPSECAGMVDGTKCTETCGCPPCGQQPPSVGCGYGLCIDESCVQFRTVRCKVGGTIYESCNLAAASYSISWADGKCMANSAGDVAYCAPGTTCYVTVNGQQKIGVCE